MPGPRPLLVFLITICSPSGHAAPGHVARATPAPKACVTRTREACGEGGGGSPVAVGLLQHSAQRSSTRSRGLGRAGAAPPAGSAPASPLAKHHGASPPAVNWSMPISWLHLPKAGSSIVAALVRIPGLCPRLPRNLVLSDWTMGFDNLKGFFDNYGQSCGDRLTFRGTHNGVGTNSNYRRLWRGHGVVMLRQPEQRLQSGFSNYVHSWPAAILGSPTLDIRVYAEVVKGCTVKSLTRAGESYAAPWAGNYFQDGPHWGGPCGDPSPPAPGELELAKFRLRDGFPFVGIMEEWELSVCLLHATFGGECHQSEFINTRHAQPGGTTSRYNSRRLGNWTDPFDGPLYEEGKRIFRERLRAFGLSTAACQPCFQQAGIEFPPLK